MAAPTLLSPGAVELVKIAVAAAGAAVLLWGWWQRRRGTPERHRRPRDAALLLLGLLGAACWTNLFQFRPGFVHGWDTFHHYVGGKYFRELGYTRLYLCTALADAADGPRPGRPAGPVRDLETDDLVPRAALLARAEECTARFGPGRWDAFRHDVRWFRERMDPGRWGRMLQDHGYNASPAWAAAGTVLAGTGPATWTQIRLLALIDVVLLAGMWALVWWTFGWRGTCVALIYWGTNFPARFSWTGGAFLRQDWLVLTVAGVCLLRRSRPLLAGVGLGWAACSRVFPATALVGVVVQAAAAAWHDRALRPFRAAAAALAGAGLAAAVLLPLGAAAGGGWEAWASFRDNSVKHVASPLTNRMGLATLFGYDAAHRLRRQGDAPAAGSRPIPWGEAYASALTRRHPAFLLAAGGYVAALAWAARRQAPWVAAVLGIGLIAGIGEITCYYYSVLLLYGLLGDRREGIAAALCGLAAAGGLAGRLVPWEDDVYALVSALTLGFLVGAMIALARDPVGPAPDARPGAR